MFRFPFYGYPYSYPYYRYQMQTPTQVQATENKNESKRDSVINSNELNNTINSNSSSDSEDAIFEIFGIKLYLDDLIILGLLFFLYKEDVHDEILFCILLLLLIG